MAEKYQSGTWIAFNAGALCREMSLAEGRKQLGIAEGVLIPEGREAVLVQPLGNDAHTVFFPKSNQFGWVYNFDFRVDEDRPRLALNLEKR